MDSASKNVQFVLQAVVDQDARASVLSFATELKRAQDSLKGFSDATVASLANANREINQTLHSMTTTRTRIAEAGAERLAAIEENLSKIIRDRSQRTTNDVIDDIDERVRAEEAANRRVRNMPAPVPVPGTGGAGSGSGAGGGANGDQAEQDRRARAYEDANLRIVRSEGATAAYVQKASGMSADAYSSLQGQLRNMRREMFATAAEASGSLMQMVRGFMALGLAGEDDLEKVARGLVKVQAMFDMVSGGTRVMLALEKVMHLYRSATQAATVAQDGFNASLARGQAVNALGMLGGLGGAVSGMAGRVRSLFTSKVAKEALEDAAKAEAARQAAYLGTSAAAGATAPVAAKAAGGFMAGTILGKTVPALGIGGIALAAAGSATFAGAGALGMARQARSAGVGGGAAPGSYTDRWGGWDFNPFGWLPENIMGSGLGGGRASKFAAQESIKRTEKMEARSGSFQQMNTDDFARLEQSGTALQASMLAARESSSAIFRNSLEGMKTEEKRAAIVSRLSDAEKESSRLKSQAAATDERFSAAKMATEASLRSSRQEEIDLLNQQVSIERQLSEEKKNAAREKLSAETESLSKMEAQLKLSKDQLLSARERFALMNEGDQMSITQLAGRLKSGAQMSAEELGKLSSFRDLGGVKEAFDAQLDRRAKSGGFDTTFGGAAQAAIDATEAKTKAQREIVASLKTEINVTIDADTKKITDELNKKLGEKLKQLGDEIRTSVSKLEGEVTDIQQRLINRANQP